MNNTLILTILEYEIFCEIGEGEKEFCREQLIAEFRLPVLEEEGSSIALGRGSDVIQIGVQFDGIVRRGISRRHCLMFRQDGEILIKPLDGTILDLSRRAIRDAEMLHSGSAYILFDSKFFRSELKVESLDSIVRRLEHDPTRDTASFGEIQAGEEILTQLLEHRQAFRQAMEGLALREQEILRRLAIVEDNDRRQSSILKKAIVIGALVVVGALGLKSLNIEALSSISNVIMAGVAVAGLLISQKSS